MSMQITTPNMMTRYITKSTKKYKGAALIGFYTGKKRKYTTIDKFQKIGRENRE